MRHPIKAVLVISSALLVSACSASDMEHFWSAGPGDWSAMNTDYGSAGSTNLDAQRRASNAQCINTGGQLVGNTCTGRY